MESGEQDPAPESSVTVPTAGLAPGDLQARLPTLAMRDGYEQHHFERLGGLAERVAAQCGESVADARLVAGLRSIGKLTLPAAVLDRPGPLPDDQWAAVCSHPLTGERLVAQAGSDPELARAVRAAYERFDGLGYPDGLAGHEIPAAARITLVCEAFISMRSPRPYRRALSLAEVVQEVVLMAGRQFCPASAAALLTLVGFEGGGERVRAPDGSAAIDLPPVSEGKPPQARRGVRPGLPADRGDGIVGGASASEGGREGRPMPCSATSGSARDSRSGPSASSKVTSSASWPYRTRASA